MNRTSTVNAVLAVLLVALCAWLVVFVVRGDKAAPGTTPAESVASEYSDSTRAARAETMAFLSVDHKKMDELTARVLEGATGTFKKQYQSSVKSLKDTAIAQESISKGSVNEIGLSEVDSDAATVFVAAASKVQNKGTKGKVEDRAWRIKLSMVKQDSRWLVSQLEFVG